MQPQSQLYLKPTYIMMHNIAELSSHQLNTTFTMENKL